VEEGGGRINCYAPSCEVLQKREGKSLRHKGISVNYKRAARRKNESGQLETERERTPLIAPDWNIKEDMTKTTPSKLEGKTPGGGKEEANVASKNPTWGGVHKVGLEEKGKVQENKTAEGLPQQWKAVIPTKAAQGGRLLSQGRRKRLGFSRTFRRGRKKLRILVNSNT